MANRLTRTENEAFERFLQLALAHIPAALWTEADKNAVALVRAIIAESKPVGRPRTVSHDATNPKCPCVECRKSRKESLARKVNDAMSADLG